MRPATALTVPDSLRRNIRFFKHEAADAWLDAALALAESLAARWAVTPESVLEGGAMSVCVLCRDQAGTPAVLKVPADRFAGQAESAALAAWAGGAVPDVLAVDEVTGAFLMEFITAGPGAPEPVELVTALDRLHITPPAGTAALELILGARIHGAAKRFADLPSQSLDLAAATALVTELQSTAEPVLVHGDFQAKNILHSPRGPVVIDPLPGAGDACSDLGLWIAGGSGGPRTDALRDYSALSAEPDRLLAWAWALTVIEYRPGTATADDAAVFIADHRDAAAPRPVAVLAA